MTGLKILIVDDEQPARKKLRAYLKAEAGIADIREAENGVAAVQCIRAQSPDLVFLDIQMPGMNGFEVIAEVGAEEMPAVIFVTAYDQYAVAAFEVRALDYLLKPFDQERFQKAFHRALELIPAQPERSATVQKLLEEMLREGQYLQRILVSSGAKRFFIKTGEIVFISAEEKYVRLHTEKESYLLRETMNALEQRLDPSKFARIHRSHLVNLDCVQEIQPWSHGDALVVLKNGTKLACSRRYRERLLGEK
jgi:two-component system LytT family response regulator